jgi:hypothetical protein
VELTRLAIAIASTRTDWFRDTLSQASDGFAPVTTPKPEYAVSANPLRTSSLILSLLLALLATAGCSNEETVCVEVYFCCALGCYTDAEAANLGPDPCDCMPDTAEGGDDPDGVCSPTTEETCTYQ